MSSFKYVLDTKEVPESFRNQTVQFETVEQLPDTHAKFDDAAKSALVAQAEALFDDPISASAAMISVYNLQTQKDIKDATNKKDATLETVQAAFTSGVKKLHKRLRGTTTGTPKAASGKQKAKTEVEVLAKMEAEATDPATVAFLKNRREEAQARLAALGATTPAPATTNAAPAAPAAPAKAGKNK